MSVTPEVSQPVMAPYVAMAAAASSSYHVTAASRSALLVNVPVKFGAMSRPPAAFCREGRACKAGGWGLGMARLRCGRHPRWEGLTIS